MDGVKSIFTSKTFWGALIALIAIIAKGFGLDLPSADEAAISGSATDLITAASDHNWTALITTIAALGGTLFAIYGRFKATKAIK